MAIVPPEALSLAMGWDLVDPQYVGTLVLWWGVDAWVRVVLLALLLGLSAPARATKSPLQVLPAVLNAEALLDVRSGIVALAGFVPALIALALLGVSTPGAVLAVLALAGLGSFPAFGYFLRRSLASAGLLLGQVSRGAEALDWSRDRLAHQWRPFLRLALPWWALSWVLDGCSMGLGSGDAWGPSALAWLLGVPSLIAGLLPIALFVASDETL